MQSENYFHLVFFIIAEYRQNVALNRCTVNFHFCYPPGFAVSVGDPDVVKCISVLPGNRKFLLLPGDAGVNNQAVKSRTHTQNVLAGCHKGPGSSSGEP